VGVYYGALLSLDLVWNISDITNAFMAIPNLIAVLLLSGVIVRETKKYLWENRLDEEDNEQIPTI
jgi:AGCS family alanine or glycine:cation symporter